MKNPFIPGRPASGASLIGQNTTIEALVDACQGANNTLALAPDGYGKTSFLQEVARRAGERIPGLIRVLVDVAGCRNAVSFYARFRDAVLQASGEGERLRAVFDKPDASVLEMVQFIAMDRMQNGGVFIDNFHYIMDFPNADELLSLLRSRWMRHSRVFYSLFSARETQVSPLFEMRAGALYGFARIVRLPCPSDNAWIACISDAFSASGKSAGVTSIASLLDKTARQPAAIQLLASLWWLKTEKRATQELLDEAYREILRMFGQAYQRVYNTLSEKQVSFLYAVIAGVPSFYSAETRSRFDLGTIGNIRRMKEALEAKEILVTTGKGLPRFQDPFFKAWLTTLPDCVR